MRGSRVRQPVSLRTKINGLVVLIIGIILTLVICAISYLIISWQFEETGQDALALADTVASMPQIIHAFSEPNPSATIQPLAENLRRKTGAEFIVVGNMQLIRYSHPNPDSIGQKMVGGDDEQVLKGKDSVTQAVGTLGLSVRGKAPIFDASHHQIGVVSVGFLVADIWKKVLTSVLNLTLIGGIGLIAGLFGGHWLSGHIKKQIFNMEPFEIALLTQEQGAILQSIREGILSIDHTGRITAGNQEAKRLLQIDAKEEIVGKSIIDIVPGSRLPEVLEGGESHRDHPMIIGNTLTIVNRVPVMLNGTVIGAVASFRDKMQLDQIDEHLADIGHYVEALRSQRHEFMNRLHTISGLIEVGEYDLVREWINQVNDEQQRVLEFFMSRVRDSAVVGLLIGKMHRAKELGIQLQVDADTHLLDPCPHREIVVTILGNAIENAFEAIVQWSERSREPEVVVKLSDRDERLFMEVRDNGPGIDPRVGERIFEDGFSSKGPGRGFGLTLLSRLVQNAGGELVMLSGSGGATLQANLPLKKEMES